MLQCGQEWSKERHLKVGVPHCPGYGTRIQGVVFSMSVLSVRQ